MELNWTTFILELINFLILVWILKKVLYAPIKKIIQERKAAVDKVIQDATAKNQAAEELERKYENRLQDWEQEKAQKLIELQQELATERKQQLDLLTQKLEGEKEKAQARLRANLTSIVARKTKDAKNSAITFAAKMLAEFADANLETKILQLFVKQFAQLPTETVEMLKNVLANNGQTLQVKSAFALPDEQKELLCQTFTKLIDNKSFTSNFTVVPELLAGLHFSVGPIVFHANLRDELKFFAEVPDHE